MATVNIAITATVAQLRAFADELGYQEFITGIDETTGLPETIANPTDRKVFLQEYFKKVVVDELSKVKIKSIDNEIRDERAAEKEAYKKAIENAVTISFKA